jgi:hypothetical protein
MEEGQVIYLPELAFDLNAEESPLLTPKVLDGKHKNVSFDYRRQRLGGTSSNEFERTLKRMMHRFAEFAQQLTLQLFPPYQKDLIFGRTSFRPAEIEGRVSSKRKDDTRIHVDSFAATPVHGLRILRIFCNINPHGKPRVWHLGEPFTTVLQRFAPHIPSYGLLTAKWLKLTRTTKTLRSRYDHQMLHLHDKMKLDDHYQQTAPKKRVEFPSNSTWIAYTDQVSHAALSGQFLLEQTFYLPVSAMVNPMLSPLRQWDTFNQNHTQSPILT